jgi:hypothetical protein
MAPCRFGQQRYGPALRSGWRTRAGQSGHLRLDIRLVLLGLTRSSLIVEREIQAARQIRCACPPNRRASYVEHLHDLRLRHLTIQGCQNVGPVELPGHMQTFGTKLIHDSTVPLVQAQFGLSHA